MGDREEQLKWFDEYYDEQARNLYGAGYQAVRTNAQFICLANAHRSYRGPDKRRVINYLLDVKAQFLLVIYDLVRLHKLIQETGAKIAAPRPGAGTGFLEFNSLRGDMAVRSRAIVDKIVLLVMLSRGENWASKLKLLSKFQSYLSAQSPTPPALGALGDKLSDAAAHIDKKRNPLLHTTSDLVHQIADEPVVDINADIDCFNRLVGLGRLVKDELRGAGSPSEQSLD